ncbi:MAG: hypothetical protein AB8B87_10900 [Granulosicoccus sp.]
MSMVFTDPGWRTASGVLSISCIAQRTTRGLKRWWFFSVLLLSLGGCSTLNSTPSVKVQGDDPIALLPFENFSVTPQADMRLRRLLETQLRGSGLSDVFVYESTQQTTLKALLNTQRQMKEARRWASIQGALYGFTGAVHEWQYKNGANQEPVVGMTLSLIDLNSGDVIWQGNAAKTGWGYANLSAIADKAVSELLRQVKFVDASGDVLQHNGGR